VRKLGNTPECKNNFKRKECRPWERKQKPRQVSAKQDAGPICVIALIEPSEEIRKIRKLLGFWGNRRKPLPRANEPRKLYDA